MDRAQLLNDAEEAMRLVLDGRQSTMWTAMPGIVQSVDFDAMTCEVQPAIQGTVEDENGRIQSVDLPLLVDVPICFPSGGGFLITLPIGEGDEVLVVMASRCIDAWWQSGGVQRAMEARMHDLSDGFAIPGPRSQPNVAGSISETDLQIRNDDGDVYLSITGSGKIGVANATKDLKGVLDGMIDLITTLQTDISAFMTALAALPPGSPVAGAALNAPANTANAALATLATQLTAYKTADIGALLE